MEDLLPLRLFAYHCAVLPQLVPLLWVRTLAQLTHLLHAWQTQLAMCPGCRSCDAVVHVQMLLLHLL